MYKLKFLDQKSVWKCNCVKYARTLVPSLPYGLWTINDKKKIINSKKSRIGNVAIMDVGRPWGHVGVITWRSHGASHKTVKEANFKTCRITERTGTTHELKIIGYYDPRK